MATNFFEQQDQARRNTKWLVLYFVLAVAAIIVSTYYVISFSLTLGGYPVPNPYLLFAIVTVMTLFVVGLGSGYKIMSLSGGGSAVAEGLGGRRIQYEGGSLVEKRLINVVQEMAIASGIPAPPVYLLDESGINAFAAGYTPDDAVIGVTRGAAERLSRAELQGVIAHEFSHILNGDMKLNIRLMGLVHGILVLGILGYYLLRAGAVGGNRRNKGNFPLIAFGLGLLVIGYVGTFFGNLIKSAVNREREYLADASAVQFTRYPDGIAGALMTIGGYTRSSEVSHENADETSHMFFGRAFNDFRMLFSTHPPLEERIRRIKPEWDGNFAEAERISEDQLRKDLSEQASPETAGFAAGDSAAERAESPTGERPGGERRAASIDEDDVGRVGRPEGAHLEYARRLLNDLSRPLRQALQHPYEARGLVYALLVHPNEHDREAQLDLLNEHLEENLMTRTKLLLKHLDESAPEIRLPLVELALQELQSMSEEQKQSFLDVCRKLIHADDRVELFEWCLYSILRYALASPEEKNAKKNVHNRSIDDVKQSLNTVISHLAVIGHETDRERDNAFQKGMVELNYTYVQTVRTTELDLQTLRDAVDDLQRLAEGEREKVIRACVACVRADNQVTVKEGELLRAISELLDCPMPPILSDTFTESENGSS